VLNIFLLFRVTKWKILRIRNKEIENFECCTNWTLRQHNDIQKTSIQVNIEIPISWKWSTIIISLINLVYHTYVNEPNFEKQKPL